MASKSTKRKPATTSRTRTRSAASVKRAAAATPAFAQQSAKLYQMPFAQSDMGEAARNASETMRQAAENMMKTSNDMMQQFWSQSGTQSRQSPSASNPFAQAEQAFSYGRESLEQLTKTAGKSSLHAGDVYELIRENIEALVACANIAANLSKQLAAHSVAFSNKSFSQQVELSKQALSCRTLNDVFDLSSKTAKTFFDNFFSEMISVSELVFQTASDISEPLNERFNESAERVSKMIQQ